MNVVDVKNLTTELNHVIIHKDLNFQVQKNQIVAIVGPSGCGKTTLLRCIMRLQKPVSGEIKVFGDDILTCSEKVMQSVRLRWGVLFQAGALFSSLTVLENIAFPMRILAGIGNEESAELAQIKLAMVGLPDKAKYLYPAELSGGMIKRTALARALALDPQLLLLDEPTSGLDPESAQSFNNLLLQLRESLGFTVVMVTHDMASLDMVADSVALLDDQKVVVNAPMSDIEKAGDPNVLAFFHGMRQQQPVGRV